MTSPQALAALAVSLGLSLATVALAQPPEGEGGHAKGLLIRTAPAKGGAGLKVSTPAYRDGADIPFENTQYRGDIFPGLTWGKGPKGTQSYVVVMQGALGAGDDLSLGTSIHFTLFNVPAAVTRLDAGLTKPPGGALFGQTVHGLKDAYAGPHTHNYIKHAYHLQVLALDTVLQGDPDMTVTKLGKLLEGHVLASGEVVGMAAMDPLSPEAKDFAAKGGKPPAAQN